MSKNQTDQSRARVLHQRSTHLWLHLDKVIKETALERSPLFLDREACATVFNLSREIEEGATTPVELASSATNMIFCGYQVSQFVDVDQTIRATTSLLTRYPADIIVLLIDVDRGIAASERSPPNIGQVTNWLKEICLRVTFAANCARRAVAREDWCQRRWS